MVIKEHILNERMQAKENSRSHLTIVPEMCVMLTAAIIAGGAVFAGIAAAISARLAGGYLWVFFMLYLLAIEVFLLPLTYWLWLGALKKSRWKYVLLGSYCSTYLWTMYGVLLAIGFYDYRIVDDELLVFTFMGFSCLTMMIWGVIYRVAKRFKRRQLENMEA